MTFTLSIKVDLAEDECLPDLETFQAALSELIAFTDIQWPDLALKEAFQAALEEHSTGQPDEAFDMDGTLMDYDTTGVPVVNDTLLAVLAAQGVKRIAIVTNQGGLPFGVSGLRTADGDPFATPAEFIWRLQALVRRAAEYGISIPRIRISVFHPKAQAKDITTAANQLRRLLANLPDPMDWTVMTSKKSRKPSGAMLISVGAKRYYGDSPEDEQAAADAGCQFVKIPRFQPRSRA